MGKDAIKHKTELDAHDIMQLLPHRYPFLLVDRLVYTSEDRLSAIGYKGITMNEPCFMGHFLKTLFSPVFYKLRQWRRRWSDDHWCEPNTRTRQSLFGED